MSYNLLTLDLTDMTSGYMKSDLFFLLFQLKNCINLNITFFRVLRLGVGTHSLLTQTE